MKTIFLYAIIGILLTSCSNVEYLDKRLEKPALASCKGSTPHQLLEGAMPQYPKELMSSSVEGFVILKLDVNKKGKAENILVVASSPKGYFEKYAIKAAKKWKYKPAVMNNKFVTTKNIYTAARFCIVDRDPICKDPKPEMMKIMSAISREEVVCEQ